MHTWKYFVHAVSSVALVIYLGLNPVVFFADDVML